MWHLIYNLHPIFGSKSLPKCNDDFQSKGTPFHKVSLKSISFYIILLTNQQIVTNTFWDADKAKHKSEDTIYLAKILKREH